MDLFIPVKNHLTYIRCYLTTYWVIYTQYKQHFILSNVSESKNGHITVL